MPAFAARDVNALLTGLVSVAAILLLATGAPTASRAASASFQGLSFLSGYSSSIATGVSGDGSVVVGCGSPSTSCTTGAQAFRWTAGGGMVGLGYISGDSYSWANSVNSDGSVVVGLSGAGTGTQAFRWASGGGMVGLGYISGYTGSVASGVSGDGSIVVGLSCTSSNCQAFRRPSGGVMVGLGFLSGYSNSQAKGVSSDGSVVVGCGSATVYCTDNGAQAFRWTSGGVMVGLGFLSGDSNSIALSGSGDGSVAVGASCTSFPTCQAFRWTPGGMVGLGYLSGYPASYATSVNGDGSVVVGASCTSFPTCQAFRWTAAGGMKSIKDLLTAAGVNITGWILQYATGVSKDGTTIVGYGIDPSGNTQAWIAYIPLPPPGVLSVLPTTPLNFNGSVGGPFASDMSGQFTLSNTGTQSLNYSISPPYWLTVSPSSSGSLAGGASASVMIFPGPSAVAASAGNYASAITFMNTTNGSGNTSVVTNLLVTQPLGGSLDSNDNGRSNPPPDAVAGINRPPQLPSP